jgi:selenium metabolism protein YedF
MAEAGKDAATPGTVVVVNAETMGRGDDWLGAKLLGSFLRAVASVDPALDAVVFYNAGVKLLGPGSVHLGVLRELQAAGVDLLACVICLDYYDLTKRIEVGRVSNMREVAQRMAIAARVVTI